MRSANKQISLRPQDLIVALKLALLGERPFTYAWLATELAIASSEVHASVSRALLARLLTDESGSIRPIRAAVREFVLHGVRYAFPAVTGPMTRGTPTAHGAPIFRERFQTEETPVWPMVNGAARGPALYPLYSNLPIAAFRDPKLYDMVSLIDALRIGAARERDFASELLDQRLA